MKRFILSIAVLLGFISAAAAQDPKMVANYLKSMGSSEVLFTMSGTGLDGTEFKAQEGKLEVQYPDFRIEAAGHLIYCKGDTLWLYNPKTEEVVISDSMLGALMADSSITVGNDGKPVLTFSNKNGSRMTFILKKVIPHDKWLGNHFILDTKSLGDDVIVTDMRK